VTLTNAEKQARYRERHLGADGEKMRVGVNLDAATRTKMGRLARHRGYTITALVEELVERAERRVTARLPSSALKTYRVDSEPMEWINGRRRAHARINQVNGRDRSRAAAGRRGMTRRNPTT
jgi:predicted DNA-binding ribbon-helix-helix protein